MFVLLVDTSLGDAVALKLDALAARRPRARVIVTRTSDRVPLASSTNPSSTGTTSLAYASTPTASASDACARLPKKNCRQNWW